MGTKLMDESGKRYGKWTVISRDEKKYSSREARWICKCDCGNISSVPGANLRKGISTSCGCNREKDISGQRFGKLVAISRDSSKNQWWVCQCDCGNQALIRGTNLREGSTKSCGCISTVIDETGNKYGEYTVLYRVENDVKKDNNGIIISGTAMWMCQCSCGKKKIVSGGLLRSGAVKHCGHLRLAEGESAFNYIYSSNKKGAKRRGLSWEISKDDFRILVSENCFYCGNPPRNSTKYRKDLNGEFMYNGLDRVDNSKGYILDNVVPCCAECNFAKHTMSFDKFKNLIVRIYNHWASTG